jgi:hypothetical protein
LRNAWENSGWGLGRRALFGQQRLVTGE